MNILKTKALAVLLFVAATALCCMADEPYVETTVFEVRDVATPVTLDTDRGTISVYDGTTLNGVYTVRSATDANGNKVNFSSQYQRRKMGSDNFYTRTYTIRPGYGSSSSSSSSSSSTTKRRHPKKERVYVAPFSSDDEVDLGLPSGILWAGYDLGASGPLDTGTFYAWGETTGKYFFDDIHYFDLYHDNYLNYAAGKRTSLLAAHDAARTELGTGWQIPTKADWDELVDNCSWQMQKYNGIVGVRATGPNGTSIFFAINGVADGKNVEDWMSAYWANNLSGSSSAHCFMVYNSKDMGNGHGMSELLRSNGAFIRPVWKSNAVTDSQADLASIVTKPAGAEAEALLEQQRKAEAATATAVAQGAGGKFSRNGNTFTLGNVTFTMVDVEGSTFTMGGTKEMGKNVDKDEKPTHKVTLDSFKIGQTEVTQALWETVMGNNPSKDKDNEVGPNLPVTGVSWNDAHAFIEALNSITGLKFRLPTEAEWEYAARGGVKATPTMYAGSNNLTEVASVLRENWNSIEDRLDVSPVASKKANELGIYDMTGNAAELCENTFYNYPKGNEVNPCPRISGKKIIVRGGSWSTNHDELHLSYREYANKETKADDVGLRLVLAE